MPSHAHVLPAKILALAQLGAKVRHVFMSEWDAQVLFLAQSICSCVGQPPEFVFRDMKTRPNSSVPLDLLFLTTPCISFSSAGKNEAQRES